MTDPVLAVEARMTPQERQKFLNRMTGANPHLHGAAVADVLDMLYEQDAFLGVVEPFHEAHEALWLDNDQEMRMRLSYAVRAAVVLLELEALSESYVEPPPEAMLPLVTRLAGIS
jgi:hypothetical protein